MGIPFNILTFDGLRGLQSRKSLTGKAPQEAETALNGFFDKKGAFVERRGGEKYNTTALANEVTGLFYFEYSAGGSQKLIIGSGTDLFEGGSGTPSSIKAGLTGGTWDFDDFHVVDELFTTEKDFVFCTNGVDTMQKYDGTTATDAGIATPATAPTATPQTTGGSLADGVYLIRVTYISADGLESNPSDQVSATVSGGGGNGSIDLSSIPVSADTQVTDRNVYMTSVGGATQLFNSAVGDNVATTHTITADSAGALLEYDHDVPPDAFFIETGKDRMFAARTADHPNRVFFSRQYRPFYWPQGELDQTKLFYFDLPGSAPITGIRFFYDYLIIFQAESIYILVGNNELNYQLERVKNDSRAGAVSNRSIQVYENWCYYLGPESFYRTNGVQVQDVGFPVSDYFNLNSDAEDFKINVNAYDTSCSALDKENNLILFFVPTETDTKPATTFCMGLDNMVADQSGTINPNWSIWNGFEATSAAKVVENGRIRWFKGDTDGFIFRMNQLDGDGAVVTSTATAGAATTLTDTTQSWTTNLYSALTVTILSGTGEGQTRTVSSNTATVLTVSSSWTTNPDATSVYTIGGIDFQYQHSHNSYGQPSLSKRWRYYRPRLDTSGDFTVTYTFIYDYIEAEADEINTTLSGSSTWDVALWDVATWDSSALAQAKFPVVSNRVHRWSSFKIRNQRAGQNIVYNGMDKIFQMKGLR